MQVQMTAITSQVKDLVSKLFVERWMRIILQNNKKKQLYIAISDSQLTQRCAYSNQEPVKVTTQLGTSYSEVF